MEREARAIAHGFPLVEPPRLAVVRALCAVYEGADVPMAVLTVAKTRKTDTADSAKCVAVVLGDAQQRLSVMGGREGMPRSLSSVLGCFVARFVGGLCGMQSRVISTPDVRSITSGVAVSRDGTTLLVSCCKGGSEAIHEFHVSDGAHLRTIGRCGSGPLQFRSPCQVWIASDDFVFVADRGNNRIQILTPVSLDFHGFVGVRQLFHPHGVCADEEIVAVSELHIYRISVFSRSDGALLRRFGSIGSGNGQTDGPWGLCFVTESRHIAVAEHYNHRVSVFSVDGEFIRHVGAGELRHPTSVACSAFDELIVVTDDYTRRVVVFSASGELLNTIRGGNFTGVAIHGSTIFAQTYSDNCVVLM
jgi:DNA-binding beta-propeller fold protein YncE